LAEIDSEKVFESSPSSVFFSLFMFLPSEEEPLVVEVEAGVEDDDDPLAAFSSFHAAPLTVVVLTFFTFFRGDRINYSFWSISRLSS
jgi:hypothetical protein